MAFIWSFMDWLGCFYNSCSLELQGLCKEREKIKAVSLLWPLLPPTCHSFLPLLSHNIRETSLAVIVSRCCHNAADMQTRIEKDQRWAEETESELSDITRECINTLLTLREKNSPTKVACCLNRTYWEIRSHELRGVVFCNIQHSSREFSLDYPLLEEDVSASSAQFSFINPFT